jgi:hypothetical protein
MSMGSGKCSGLLECRLPIELQPLKPTLLYQDKITMEKQFQDFLVNDTANVDPMRFVFNLLVAAALSWALAKIYRLKANTLSNRGGFAANFQLLTMTTTLVITVVKTSLALSLGLVGALSIVRFRAAIKEPEELNFLFICIAIGLGLGANQLLLTLLAFVILCASLILRGRFGGAVVSKTGNLHLRYSGDQGFKLDELLPVLEPHCSQLSLSRLDQAGNVSEACFHVVIDTPTSLEAIRVQLNQKFPGIGFTYLDSVPVFDEN